VISPSQGIQIDVGNGTIAILSNSDGETLLNTTEIFIEHKNSDCNVLVEKRHKAYLEKLYCMVVYYA
jgi:hypothetical protein